MDNLQSAILSRFTNAIPTPIRLRDLIRQIRAARTAAEERAVVQKECAYIRSTFREDDNLWRCRNVAKLLYIHMLGYPAHFGQLECLKLIASSRYTDKRIGYLGAMLLLDERQDVHLLITNSLKNDLNSPQQFVVGLALCCLGAICSAEMSRDLLEEVERLMKSTNSYIKKKAALCAARMIRKLPDLCEMFLPVAKIYLSEKNHGCIISGITLITEMCEQNSEALFYYKKNNEFVNSLVKILKNLIMSGYSPEHDVSGVSDPFLQIAILRLLRIMGRNDEATSEIMNDILAQVATNTEGNKNVGNAILYETVISIMEIKSESSLRVLGINILGRFLLNMDKNIRYVALTTLAKTVQADYNAVQRHRTTIVDCLKDPDVSIRKKALELCFTLINENNIKTMSKELIYFLEKADPEFKSMCSSNLCIAAEKYAPDPKWHIDTVIRLLKTAGNYVRDDIVGMLIELISSVESLHTYATCQLWTQLLHNDLSTKQPLVQVSMWTIGEFGDLLVQSSGTAELDGETVTADDLVDKCEHVLSSIPMTLITKEYSINALIKLSVRFAEVTNRAKQIIDLFGVSHSVELQQRAVEFTVLFTRHDNLRPSVLEKMPAMERKDRKVGEAIEGESNDDETVNGHDNGVTEAGSSALLDLLNLSSGEGLSTTTSKALANEINDNVANDVLDLLGSLDVSAPPAATTNSIASVGQASSNLLEGLFDTTSKLPTGLNGTAAPNLLDNGGGVGLLDMDDLGLVSTTTPKASSIPPITSYDKNGLKIEFTFERSLNDQHTLLITMVAHNSTTSPMDEFLFQAAVPKSFQLQLMPPSGPTIAANLAGSVSQLIKVINPNKGQLKMRLRLSYKHNGQSVLEQADVTNFPPQTWQ